MIHLEMIVPGLPYAFQNRMDRGKVIEVSPYSTTITGLKGEKMPSESEMPAAHFQGRYVASSGLKAS
jgi:NAD(P)H dehydrogenase (quinone)